MAEKFPADSATGHIEYTFSRKLAYYIPSQHEEISEPGSRLPLEYWLSSPLW